MADDVQVKLGADISPLKDGMDEAQASVADSLSKIADALQNFGGKNKDVTSEAVRNNADLSRSFVELKGSATDGFNAIAGVIERVRGVLATLTAALAGGAIFKGSVDSLLNLEDSVRGLVIAFGMSAQAATQQAIALKLAGVSAETFEQMGQRVGRVLRTQSEEFDRLKVVTKDANGNLLPMGQILQNIYTRMQDFKAGTDQTEFALSTVGRNAKDFASDMERITAATERATQMQHDLGIEMGPDRIAQIEQYRQDFNAFGVVLEEVGVKIGEAVLPRLEGLASWFNDIGPTAIRYITNAVLGLLTVLQGLGTLAASVLIIATNAFNNIALGASAAWQAAKLAVTGQWDAAAAVLATTNAKITANNKATTDAVVDLWARAAEKVNQMWAGSPAPKSSGRTGIPKSGSERFSPKPTGAEDNISGLENELKAEENAYNQRMLQQGSFQTWSITQTRDYWEEVLSMTDLSAKQRLQAESKYYDAERLVQQQAFAATIAGYEADKAALGHNIDAKIAIGQKEYDAIVQRYGAESAQAQEAYKRLVELRQQLADQRERIAEIEEKSSEATYKFQIEMEKLNADQAVALRQMSAEQRLAVEKDFISKEYQAEVDGINARIALLANDPNSDPVKLAALKAQLLAIEQNYQKQLTQIDYQAEQDRQHDALEAAQDFQNDFSAALASVADGTKSLKNAFQDFFRSLDQQLSKIASDQIAKQLFGAGTEGGSALNSIFGKIFGGAGSGSTASAGAALTTAGTTLQTASTTLEAAATTLQAAATSLQSASLGGGGGLGNLFDAGGDLGDLASFASGTPFVPRDMVAQIHRGEAIIPASMNTGAAGSISVSNQFMFGGSVDTRTQHQIALQTQRATERAVRRSR